MKELVDYIVSLKEIGSEVETFSCHLGDDFFAQMKNDEVSRGNVAGEVKVKRLGEESFELAFSAKGEIIIPCNRCLGDMSLPVSIEETMLVKFGKEFSENEADDSVIVPEDEGTINVGWFIFEFIVLGIPITHVHPKGACDEETYNRLKQVMVLKEDESSDEEFEEIADEREKPMDARWSELEKLKNKLN
ncbi:MAG: DUF177 domain-containing protein [Bacteroidales bacterium]|nr:DUF177 domain-containing protein [Bacteroidales bacterium]MBR6311137.1 DUF177 domain-containing protein [Paludibacteraceae bacterium]MDD6357281.1 DUF177 domain-containing protein [Bacteroidales bacterium]